MKRINVLYIAGWGDLRSGGPISLLNLLQKLDRERFKPLVVCPSPGTLVEVLKSTNIETEIINIKSLKKLHLFSFFSSIVRLSKLIKAQKIDIVHSNAACSRESFSGAIAAKIGKIPFIYHVRTLDSAGWIEKILAGLSAKIVVISDAVSKKFYWLKNPKKIIKIYNGVDVEKFNPAINPETMRKEFGLNSKTVVIGTAGILAPLKGFQYFLEAVAEIIKKCPDAKFLVVGETAEKFKDYKRKLENLIDFLKLNKKIVFAEFRKDFPQILAGIDIFVLSSTKEAFGRVLIEAQACGKPVVASCVGGIPEVVKNKVTGILVPSKNPRAIAEAVMDLIKNREKAKRMGLAGRKRVEAFFDINYNAHRTMELYGELAR